MARGEMQRNEMGGGSPIVQKGKGKNDWENTSEARPVHLHILKQ